MKKYSPDLFSAIFLVAGTCIGGGMLALPVVTAQIGFVPSAIMMIVAWAAMTATALYLTEVGFWMRKDDAHVISMSSSLLGLPGKAIAWIIYLFISYASIVAYTAGGGHLITQAAEYLRLGELSHGVGCIIFMLLFGPIIFCSHKILGKVNSWLFYAMLAAYVIIVVLGSQEVKPKLLERQDWGIAALALPMLLTSFSMQTMVPSLHPYLQHDGKSLKVAIIAGTSIALIFYLIWQFIVLGSVPVSGPHGLLEALKGGHAATHYLGKHVSNGLLEMCAHFFAFFALVTSFFGMSLGLYDFLSDGLSISKKGKGGVLLALLIIVPTLVSAISLEKIFLLALDVSGGFGDAILNGIMPVCMIWLGRYVYMKRAGDSYRIPSSKPVLMFVCAFFVGVLLIEVFMRTGHIPAVTDVRELDFDVNILP